MVYLAGEYTHEGYDRSRSTESTTTRFSAVLEVVLGELKHWLYCSSSIVKLMDSLIG